MTAMPGALLPVAPSSFRDFMLFEDHVTAASRAIARRYLPTASRVAATYELLTRRTFPKFRPAALWYEQPIYYFGNHLNFVASGTPIAAPAYADSLDYELELGFVIDKPLLDASPDEATAAIAGYVVLNDCSARNVQVREMRSGFGPQKAKHFLSSMSSDLVPATSIDDPHDLTASVSLNGVLITTTSTRRPQHTIAEALAFASCGVQLHPGELFGTGTLPGGSGLENGRLLAPGDVLELTIDRIGTIRHTITAPGGTP
ncbi:MAG: fumarylacetoacetate hydrolase family protein [Nocardioidaceae bacterium]